MGKKEIYASYGIDYQAGKLYNSVFGYVSPMLINGNAKLGKGVWTFSTLPGTLDYTICGHSVKGTCACDCKGCYAQSGFYRMNSTINALGIRTILARLALDFVKRAIIAQIKADKIKLCRIHASGDFFSLDYIQAWRDIAAACADCVFWSYTKYQAAENAFDDLANVNIVKSLVPGIGMNYGHCDYILDTYHTLKNAGKSVHICKCGIDKTQHCVNCKGCSENEYVLFIEHSTDYRAESDTAYPQLAQIANAQ